AARDSQRDPALTFRTGAARFSPCGFRFGARYSSKTRIMRGSCGLERLEVDSSSTPSPYSMSTRRRRRLTILDDANDAVELAGNGVELASIQTECAGLGGNHWIGFDADHVVP